MKKRNTFFDIVKAIGIISIVIGHCWVDMGPFVYTYHLAIFFFVGGYFYNFEKYAKKPFEYIGSRLKGSYGKYVLYGIIFILLHNILLKIGVYSLPTAFYSLRDILGQIVSTTIFMNSETMLGAMWFVPVLVYSMGLFGFTAYYADKLPTKFKLSAIGIACLFLGGLGLIFVKIDYTVIYHLQIAFLIMPIIFLGYLLKTKVTEEKLMKYLKSPLMIISVILITIVLSKTGRSISLSEGQIISTYIFYPISIVGIYFCLCLAKILSYFSKVGNIFAAIGRHSFDIMALHFIAFKIVDFFYILATGRDMALLSVFPFSFGKLYPIYIVFGILFPIFCCTIIRRIKDYTSNKIGQRIANN